MEVNWKYLIAPIGKHWADKYINYEMLNHIIKNGWPVIGFKKGGFKDPGLGDFRFATIGGSLRPLLSSSVKIEKSDGSAAFVRVLYISPSKESDLPIHLVFPKKWTPGTSCYEGVPVPKYRLNPKTALVCTQCGKPAKLAGGRRRNPNACAGAGACKYTCITTSGQMTQQQRTRYAKTWYFYTEPILFIRQILTEVYLYAQEAFINEMLFYARLNGTSDIPWEYLIHMDEFTQATKGMGGWYDYTKLPWSQRGGRKWTQLMGSRPYPDYYHLTYSLDEKGASDRHSTPYLMQGYGLSVVTPAKNQKWLLKNYGTKRKSSFVVDGDLTDFRFADPIRAIVVLKSKGALVQKSTEREDDYAKYKRWLKGVTPAGKKTKVKKLEPWQKKHFAYLKTYFGKPTAFDKHLKMEMGYLYAKPTLNKSQKARLKLLESGCFDFKADYELGRSFRSIHGGGCNVLEQARPLTLEWEIARIVKKIDEVEEMDRRHPLHKRPNVLEKPTSFDQQAIGIRQSSGEQFYDRGPVFMDHPAYKKAQKGRYTREEKAWAEKLEKLNRFYELSADDPSLTKTEIAKKMQTSVAKINSLLKEEKDGKLTRSYQEEIKTAANPRRRRNTKRPTLLK